MRLELRSDDALYISSVSREEAPTLTQNATVLEQVPVRHCRGACRSQSNIQGSRHNQHVLVGRSSHCPGSCYIQRVMHRDAL